MSEPTPKSPLEQRLTNDYEALELCRSSAAFRIALSLKEANLSELMGIALDGLAGVDDANPREMAEYHEEFLDGHNSIDDYLIHIKTMIDEG